MLFRLGGGQNGVRRRGRIREHALLPCGTSVSPHLSPKRKRPAAVAGVRARFSQKSETMISAIADFAHKGKRKKKALPLFPLTDWRYDSRGALDVTGDHLPGVLTVNRTGTVKSNFSPDRPSGGRGNGCARRNVSIAS